MNWVGFPGLGIDKIYLTEYISVFGFPIYWYGILIACGLVLAMLYAFFHAEKFGVDSDRMMDVVILGVVGGIIGARLYYVIFQWDIYCTDWLSVFDIRDGGLAIYGGLIGAIALGSLACRWRKVRLLPMLDLAGIGFLLGQGIGRWGNFVNIEAYGGHTDLPWGMTSNKISEFLSPVHPTFLYESIWCLLGFVLLCRFTKRRKFDGEVFLLYLIWYGFERFFVEGLRVDSLWLIPNTIRVSQALSAVLFLGALIMLVYILLFYMKKHPDRMYLYVQSEEWQTLIRDKKMKKKAKE